MRKIIILLFISIIFIFQIHSDDILETIKFSGNYPDIISNIKTEVKENTIEIRFNNSREDRELVIYRSTKPILTYTDLLEASLINTFSSSKNIFIDYPQPGTPYFYIIMDSILTKSGQYIMVPGGNVTEHSSILQSMNSPQETVTREILRNQPLPYLDLKSSIESGKFLLDTYSELPVEYNLSFESGKIVEELLKDLYKEKITILEPNVLEEDISSSANGEEYQLKRIIESDFITKNWEIANKLLRNFLSVDHSDKINTKAHYYLAQVLYFQNQYIDSFLEFTIIYEDLKQETKPWMDSLFTYLRN